MPAISELSMIHINHGISRRNINWSPPPPSLMVTPASQFARKKIKFKLSYQLAYEAQAPVDLQHINIWTTGLRPKWSSFINLQCSAGGSFHLCHNWLLIPRGFNNLSDISFHLKCVNGKLLIVMYTFLFRALIMYGEFRILTEKMIFVLFQNGDVEKANQWFQPAISRESGTHYLNERWI